MASSKEVFPLQGAATTGEGGVGVSAVNNRGETPLLSVARKGLRDVFDVILQHGAQTNCIDVDKWTLLHHASYNGWVDVVQRILEEGEIDVNGATCDGETPLMRAAEGGKRDVFDLLLQSGAHVNCTNNRMSTILHHASYYGWIDVVQRVMDEGAADVNAATSDGNTPLMLAAAEGHADVAAHLVRAGADVNVCNVKKETALHRACFKGHMNVVQVLLGKEGLNVDAQNENGRTPLMFAVALGHADVVARLLQAGADVNLRDAYQNTPLHFVVNMGLTPT